MDLTQAITIAVVAVTNLGTIIALYLNLDRKLDENRKETNEIIRAIQSEIQDFHGRLCAIEERKKLS